MSTKDVEIDRLKSLLREAIGYIPTGDERGNPNQRELDFIRRVNVQLGSGAGGCHGGAGTTFNTPGAVVTGETSMPGIGGHSDGSYDGGGRGYGGAGQKKPGTP